MLRSDIFSFDTRVAATSLKLKVYSSHRQIFGGILDGKKLKMQASFETNEEISSLPLSISLLSMKRHIESYCWVVTLDGTWDLYCVAHRNSDNNKMNIECEQEISHKFFALLIGVLAKIYHQQQQRDKDHCIRPSTKSVGQTVERMIVEGLLTDEEEVRIARSYKKRKSIYDVAEPYEFNRSLLYDLIIFK